MTGLAQALFAGAAGGSLAKDETGAVVGSQLIAQPFSNPAYLQPRPSAAGANGYDATASSGSNLGPTSQKLHDRVAGDIERLQKENPEAEGPVPADLVTTSGSGLDPHLSPAAALWQVPRIAQARGVEAERIRKVVESCIEPPTLGILGEPRVNVLEVNLALNRKFGRPQNKLRPASEGAAGWVCRVQFPGRGPEKPDHPLALTRARGVTHGLTFWRWQIVPRGRGNVVDLNAVNMSVLDPRTPEPTKPRAQDFLELVHRGKRGRLKLYLGFAAGVGKTYRMLEEAHALAKARASTWSWASSKPTAGGNGRPGRRAGSHPPQGRSLSRPGRRRDGSRRDPGSPAGSGDRRRAAPHQRARLAA